MVLICGIPSESPVELLCIALEKQRTPYLMLNQRWISLADLNFRITGAKLTGILKYRDIEYPLEQFSGIYLRMMDETQLPELKGKPVNHPEKLHYDSFQKNLISLTEIYDGRMVNRYSSMASNNSKPYQAQIILDCGFFTPETLITSNPDALEAFFGEYPELIYKSISGVRSIVRKLNNEDWSRIYKIRNCPVQFQQLVEGSDVRVHVIGTKTYATSVASSNVDYRYIREENNEYTILSPCLLDPLIEEQCILLSHRLGLAFSGIDLRITNDGSVYCFEVNPCPGYSYYEKNTGQTISEGLAEYLAGDQ
jgi:glutathione synthase/RimK-type ligase-like ATP-grasp enzyme